MMVSVSWKLKNDNKPLQTNRQINTVCIVLKLEITATYFRLMAENRAVDDPCVLFTESLNMLKVARHRLPISAFVASQVFVYRDVFVTNTCIW